MPGCDQACPVDKLYNLLENNAYFSLKKIVKVGFGGGDLSQPTLSFQKCKIENHKKSREKDD